MTKQEEPKKPVVIEATGHVVIPIQFIVDVKPKK